MKFNISIPQDKLADTNLDATDACILDYLYHYCSSTSVKIEKQRMVDDSGVWTWIDSNSLLKDMPILRIKSANSLTPRYKKIVNASFINMKYGVGKKIYVKFTEKGSELYLSPTVPVEPELVETRTGSTKIDSEIVNTRTGSKEDIVPEIVTTSSRNRNDEFSIYDHNTSNQLTKLDTSTNVLAEKSVYGNPDINSLCSVFEDAYGHLPKKPQQRKMSQILINKFGKDIVLRAAQYAVNISEDQYAPKITCPQELWDKWSSLVSYGKKNNASPLNNRTVNLSELARKIGGESHVT
jgi:hypothetical protein